MVTLRPHPLTWVRFVSVDANTRFEYERFLCANRVDLHDFFKLAFNEPTVQLLHDSGRVREILPTTEGAL